MKKAITFALIAILFLGLFAGCNTYRRPVATGADGAHVTRGFHYGTDGHVRDVRTTTRHSAAHNGVTGRLDGSTGNFYGSATHGTTRDGMIGDGALANRSGGTAYNGYGYGTAGTSWANGVNGTPGTVRPTVNGTTARTAR